MTELFGFPIVEDPNPKPSTIKYILGGNWEDLITVLTVNKIQNKKNTLLIMREILVKI